MPELHRLSSLTGNPDADCNIDLGAERPSSILQSPVNDTITSDENAKRDDLDTWTMSGIAPTTDLPDRPREWRSKSYAQKQKQSPNMKKVIDHDCGICFEIARTGCRTPCCRSLFCLDHISDWLNGPSSEGRCPSCGTPCMISANGNITLSDGPHPPPKPAHTSSYSPSPLPSPYSGPHESTVDVDPIGENI
ncbi:hypothetical protein J3R30DRAFT_3714989 [Lentinula aciculospora]|uniref:RING-type domain-containing protein n=1 Tax=Lentinula aciculospora TaxID=153920 RepID=A0A9W8ZW92_9AGAR|nr:hypothetical protein J3R30DRAFT_3714989 [Lentinula aciculospora]